MRRWIGIFLLILILSTATSVQAVAPAQDASAPVIQTLEIDVWPEYDRPEVLVIYRITLSAQTRLPAEMTLRLPVSSAGPSAVAEQTANGLFNLEYSEVERNSDWITIRFTTTLPQLQIEYYDNAITKADDQRGYIFRWPGDVQVDDLLIKVQQPRTAAGLTLEPNTGSTTTGQDGLIYFDVPLGKVLAGNAFQLRIRYQKTDDELTLNSGFEQVTPVNPSNPVGAPAFPQLLPWLLGGLGLVMIAGGVFWYLRGTRPAAAYPSRPRHRSTPTSSETDDAVFCHQCGKKAAPGDIFCRACGLRLRK
jgi:hypothetical protein